MPKILISYRRADSDAIAGRIRDRVAAYYGEDAVFMDIDSIPIGLDFRDHVKQALLKNDLVLAIIGPKWTGPGRGASTRIQQETDPVRMEIETALRRGIPVIPVLVGGAALPKSTELPEGLKDLPFRNAADVSAGRDFNQHMERLLRSADRIFEMKLDGAAPVEAGNAPGSATQIITVEPGMSPAKLSAVARLLARAGLNFTDPALERRFGEHFRERFYWVAQTAIAASIAAWVLFGPVDLWSEHGGIASTRFRFMFSAPLMAAYFALSFTAKARSLWQAFVAGYALLGLACMTFGLTLVASETWFAFEQATMTFMLFLAFVGLAPFNFPYALGVGLVTLMAYAWWFAAYGGSLPPVRAIFCSLLVLSSYVIACCGALARERIFRREFEERVRLERQVPSWRKRADEA